MSSPEISIKAELLIYFPSFIIKAECERNKAKIFHKNNILGFKKYLSKLLPITVADINITINDEAL